MLVKASLFQMLKAVAVGAVVAFGLTATDLAAQNIGDVGQDGNGNVFTFSYDAQGNPRWMPGRVQGAVRQRTIVGERFIPTIWTDPDGCEHWVMDDGAEGFMTPHVTPDGKPVCNRSNACGVMAGDQLFASGSARLNRGAAAALQGFFQSTGSSAYGFVGHTDSRASDASNMRLSQRRAEAVANLARQMGVRVASVSGYGERMPVASNATAQGRAQNRRVEIICYR